MQEFLWQASIAGIELWKVLFFFAVILFSLIAGRLARFLMERAASHSREKKKEMIGLLFAALSRRRRFISPVTTNHAFPP